MAAGGLQDALAGGDAPAVGAGGLDLEEASNSLRQRWRRLDLASPYSGTAEEAVELLSDARENANKALALPGLEREYAEWVRGRASREAAKRIQGALSSRGLTLRQAARSAAIAPGHLSELMDGERALPTPSTAERLDRALGTGLVELVVRTRQELAPFRLRQRRRRAPLAVPPIHTPINPRLDMLVEQLARDDRMIQLNEDMLRLPVATRRAITQLVRALAAAG